MKKTTKNFNGFKAQFRKRESSETSLCFAYEYFENGEVVVEGQIHLYDSEYWSLSEKERDEKVIAELESRKEAICTLPSITEASPFLQDLISSTYGSEGQMISWEHEDVEQSETTIPFALRDFVVQQDIDDLEEEVDKFDLYNVIEIGGDAAVTCFSSLPDYFNLLEHKPC